MEQILLRFRGGILHGATTSMEAPWPPPEKIGIVPADDGQVGLIVLDRLGDGPGLPLLAIYVKVTQSALDAETAAHPNIMRGAMYDVVNEAVIPA